jgi:hypothetical protein
MTRAVAFEQPCITNFKHLDPPAALPKHHFGEDGRWAPIERRGTIFNFWTLRL